MSTLALFGGEKSVTVDAGAVASLPVCRQKGIDVVNRLMRTGEISQSSVTSDFAQHFASYIGSTYALCTNNGTSAIDSALFALSVAPGDEVIVPSYTFWASVTPIIAQHAVPVFCDVDRETFCIDPKKIEKCITNKTKAIIVVHVWGNMCDMESIMSIARKHGIKVLEDCSHAHGASYRGKKAGLWGDVGCYSLQGTKTLPGGEGGVLVTDSRECYERAAALGHYELIQTFADDSPYKKYALTGMGHKYRIHPFAAALADSQLEHLDEVNEVREKNARRFDEGLHDIPFLKKQCEYEGSHRVFSYHYYRYVPAKEKVKEPFAFLKALHAEGVACGYCGYGRLHNAPLFTEGGPYGDCKGTRAVLPVTDELAHTTFLAAPRFETSCHSLVEQYIAAYRKVSDHIEEVIEYSQDHSFDEELNSLSGRSIAQL